MEEIVVMRSHAIILGVPQKGNTMMRFNIGICAILFALLVQAGCGPPPTPAASGHVAYSMSATLDGKPLPAWLGLKPKVVTMAMEDSHLPLRQQRIWNRKRLMMKLDWAWRSASRIFQRSL